MRYTYLLKHIPTGKLYYGVQYGEGSNPCDFWSRYFTSSSYVHQLIEQDGKQAFEFEIRKTFQTREQAQKWESKVLRRMKVNLRDDFLNKNPGLGFGYASGEKHWAYGKKYTEEHKQKNKEGQKINSAWRNTPKGHPSRLKLSETAKKTFTGYRQTKEHIENRKLFGEQNGMFGKHHTTEHKQKISDLMKVKATDTNFAGTKNLKLSVEKRMADGNHPNQIITTCQYCGKSVKSLGNYKRWHGNNCKMRS
jgi:hypothetical protein